MMILDQEGVVRYKIDKLLFKQDLIEISNLTADPNIYFVSEATKIFDSPSLQLTSVKSSKTMLPKTIISTTFKV